VRLPAAGSLLSARLLRWQVASGQGPSVFSPLLATAEATHISTTVDEVRERVKALDSELSAGWLGRYALGLANGAAAARKGSRLAIIMFEMKLVIAETMILPSAIKKQFGPRAQHLFLDSSLGKLSEEEVAKLNVLGMQIHMM